MCVVENSISRRRGGLEGLTIFGSSRRQTAESALAPFTPNGLRRFSQRCNTCFSEGRLTSPVCNACPRIAQFCSEKFSDGRSDRENKYFFARVRVELSQLTWEPRQSQSVSKSVVIRPHDGVRNSIDHFAIRRGNLQRRSVINTPGDHGVAARAGTERLE